MWKTVHSYRIALENEVARLRSFRDALPSEEEQTAFGSLMEMCSACAQHGKN
jgi:hypothetical protein